MQMKRITARASAIAAALVWLPLAAGEDFFVQPDETHAVVTGLTNQPGKELFAVRITDVNGKRTERAEGVWLRPGTYRIKAKAGDVAQYRSRDGIGSGPIHGVDRRYTRAVGRGIGLEPRDGFTLELTVEAGKIYHIALDTSSHHRHEWKLVNWRVEEQ